MTPIQQQQLVGSVFVAVCTPFLPPFLLLFSLLFPLSLPLPVIPTICCLQNKSFIYCHFQDCLYLSSDHYANHSRNRGANYQTIWRKLCFSSFGSTFQTIAIMFLSCGRVLHKQSSTLRAMVADSKGCKPRMSQKTGFYLSVLEFEKPLCSI